MMLTMRLMLRWCVTVVAVAAGATPLAFGQQTALPPAQVLTKLELTLTGRSPTPAELGAFVRRASASPAAFHEAYEERLAAFLADPDFATQVDAFHAAWWHLPAGDTTKLAAYLASHDEPYLDLFAKNYLYVSGASAKDYARAAVLTETPLPDGGAYQKVRLAPGEGRFHSILSNPDFLTTFPDTASNRNRKRANQIFRSFLCDNLVNVPLPGVVLPDAGPHGTNRDCVGCHTRLDPMARFFDQWGPAAAGETQPRYEPSHQAAGQVVLKGSDGRAIWFSGTGESALALILKDLPAVRQCLVQKIWEFALGPNAPLDAATRSSLMQTLAATGRFKPVLAQVLHHPYFWSTTAPPPLTFTQVQPVFALCTGCHQAGGAQPSVDLRRYPWRPTAAANQALLKQVLQMVSASPGVPRMPPPPQPALAAELLAKLRDWVRDGALTADGDATLNEEAIKEVLSDD